MGLDANVIVIGPLNVLAKYDVLDYPIGYYEDVPFDNLVIGTITCAYTSDQSRELAEICGVNPWDLGNHQVKNPVKPSALSCEDYIGRDSQVDIYDTIIKLLDYKNVQIWYRPNG